MRRVALLTDKGQATYARVNAYYDTRCKIAHGANASAGVVAIPAVAVDLKAIARVMRAS